MATENFIVKSIKASPLVWTTTFFSSILLALNVWLTFRLIPVEKRQDDMNSRIEAIEHRNENINPLIERFYKVEEKQVSFEKSVNDIKTTQVKMDGKLDRLIELHIK
jgi:hypothetical protein